MLQCKKMIMRKTRGGIVTEELEEELEKEGEKVKSQGIFLLFQDLKLRTKIGGKYRKKLLSMNGYHNV